MAKRHRPMAEINVVPYIDVMLVLLVIFMITTPLLSQGVQVDLPQTSAKQIASEQHEPIIVSIDGKGQYYLNVSSQPEAAMPRDKLALRVGALLALAKKQGHSRQVLVKGDQAVDYGRVVVLMSLLQHAGAEKVGLLTQSADVGSVG